MPVPGLQSAVAVVLGVMALSLETLALYCFLWIGGFDATGRDAPARLLLCVVGICGLVRVKYIVKPKL